MKNISLKLLKPLPDLFVEVLAAISNATAELEIEYFVIGATARDLILEYVYRAGIQRATGDIDFGVAIKSWDEFGVLKKKLIDYYGFRGDKKIEHRLYYVAKFSDIEVDLVPYGDIEGPSGKIEFPESGFEMSTHGFAECRSIKLEISEGIEVSVASLPSIVLLKFISYNDRPNERQDDLKDILYIAEKYLDAENEDRLYGEDNDLLEEESFDIRTVGARLLGRDMAALLNKITKQIVLKNLSDQEDGDALEHIAQLLGPRSDAYGRTDEIRATLEQLRLGITERV